MSRVNGGAPPAGSSGGAGGGGIPKLPVPTAWGVTRERLVEEGVGGEAGTYWVRLVFDTVTGTSVVWMDEESAKRLAGQVLGAATGLTLL